MLLRLAARSSRKREHEFRNRSRQGEGIWLARNDQNRRSRPDFGDDRAHFLLSTLQHSLWLDEADVAGGRLLVCLQAGLWLQPLLVSLWHWTGQRPYFRQ